jgi:uncharacterized RDD family membrane protein YckC
MANISTAEKKRRLRRAGLRRGASPEPSAPKGEKVALPRDKDGHVIYPINIASPLKRLYAFAIDVLVLYSLIVFTKALLGHRVWGANAEIQDIAIILSYFIIPTGLFGRTPGKWVAGLRVVDTEGRVPGIAAAIPREVAGRWISIFAFGIGLAWAVFDGKRQGWHDKLAGTVVINTPDAGGPRFLRKMFKIQER